MILKCTCVHKQQDELHGIDMRIHNEAKSKIPGTRIYRCTVCGNTKNK